jgi:hypothetical protein
MMGWRGGFWVLCLLCMPVILPASAAVVYVDADAAGPLHDGDSWETAFLTVQDGVNQAAARGGGQVWVAEGIYVENIRLGPGVLLYGGFAGGEDLLEERDVSSHETVLQAAHEGSVITALAATLIDGFTITGGTGTPGDGSLTFGGAIYCDQTAPLIRNNLITGNRATHGGGIACWKPGADPRIENNVIRDNEVVHDGGAIYCYRSAPEIAGNLLIGNRATYGGAIDADWRSTPRIEGNRIEGNFAANYGGGITTYWSWPLIVRNRFINNECGIDGGGVFAFHYAVSIAGNVFVGNRATYGGAVASKGDAGSIVGNTMVGNEASYGGGVGCHVGANPTLVNNIISANLADVGGGVWVDADSEAALDHNCLWDNLPEDYTNVTPGPFDLAADPLFVDAIGLDLRLRLDSPCVDAGDNSAPDLPDLDLDGGDRVVDGDGDSVAVVDIGAYELSPPECQTAVAPVGFFNPGWVWFSIPLDPWRHSSSEASDLLGFDPRNRLFAWDESAKNLMLYPDDFTILAPGRSYALSIAIGQEYRPQYHGVDSPEMHVRHMPEAGFAWVGPPGQDEIEIESVHVRRDDGGAIRSAADDRAAPDPWLSWYWIYWDPYVDTPMLCAPDSLGDTHLLRPWYGYWVYAFEPNLTILFPPG